MPTTKETWEIEVGNAAVVTETIEYFGTERGAIRAARRRWRARRENEFVLILRRPGCRPLRTEQTEGS